MFNDKYAVGLKMFSAAHLAVIAVCAAILVCVVVFRRYFASPKADKAFRWTLAGIMMAFEVTFHIWTAVSGNYSWDMFPPFGLCAITNLLTIIALFTDCKKIIEITLYWGLCGAFLSILFVDITYMPPHFRFFHYFLVHFGFALGGLYFVITGKVRPTRRGVNRSCAVLLVHSLAVLVLDLIFDRNWLYMTSPAIDGLPDFMSGTLYTVLWMLLIAAMINLWYYIIVFVLRVGSRRSRKLSDCAAATVEDSPNT
ncbi:MAG: TIGR02206 family membrane protein [Eubacteriales bacterium]